MKNHDGGRRNQCLKKVKQIKKQHIRKTKDMNPRVATNIPEHLKKTAKDKRKWVVPSIMNSNINTEGRKMTQNSPQSTKIK